MSFKRTAWKFLTYTFILYVGFYLGQKFEEKRERLIECIIQGAMIR